MILQIGNILFFVGFLVFAAILILFIRDAFRKIRWIDGTIQFREKLSSKLFAAGFATGIFIFGISEGIEYFARFEVANFLQHLKGDYTLRIAGQTVADPGRIIKVLLDVGPRLAHHSHPLKRFPLEINSGPNSLNLEIARDSGDEHEYWVFYPRNPMLKWNEIGKLQTMEFDQLSP